MPLRYRDSSPRFSEKVLEHPPRSHAPESTSDSPDLSVSRWFTAANALTSARLVAAPFCAFAILQGSTLTACLLFGLAIATDLADGRVARSRGEVSSLGGLLDHSSDALFVSLGLAALAYHGVVPLLLPGAVAAAFVQYVLDSRTLAGRPLRASWLGRWNGIAYFVMLGTPLIRDLLGIVWPGPDLVLALGWALVASTLASMLNRLMAFVRLSGTRR